MLVSSTVVALDMKMIDFASYLLEPSGRNHSKYPVHAYYLLKLAVASLLLPWPVPFSPQLGYAWSDILAPYCLRPAVI